MTENRGIPRAGYSPQGLPHPIPGRHLRVCTPAEIPVALRGVMARPGRAAEAQLTTQDGGQITVQIGTEIPVAVDSGGEGNCQTVKVVDIIGGDVIVERGGRRVSLRTLLAKP